MISLADFARKTAVEGQSKTTLKEADVGDTLAAICRPPANSASR